MITIDQSEYFPALRSGRVTLDKGNLCQMILRAILSYFQAGKSFLLAMYLNLA